MVTTEMPALMTAKDLAACLRLSVRTIWRLRSAGKLPAPLEVGGAVRWRVDEIQKWVADGCRELSTSRRK